MSHSSPKTLGTKEDMVIISLSMLLKECVVFVGGVFEVSVNLSNVSTSNIGLLIACQGQRGKKKCLFVVRIEDRWNAHYNYHYPGRTPTISGVKNILGKSLQFFFIS